MAEQQLVARIKRSSKYFYQAPPQQWFTIRIVGKPEYQVRGNCNNYRLSDVALGAVVDGGVLDFATGKAVKTEVYDIWI